MTLRLWPTTKTITARMGGTFRQSARVLATTQGDELVLLDLKGERYYILNEVGSRAWTLLANGATHTQIADAIRREYEVHVEGDDDPVGGDIARLLDELYAAHLVTADSSS